MVGVPVPTSALAGQTHRPSVGEGGRGGAMEEAVGEAGDVDATPPSRGGSQFVPGGPKGVRSGSLRRTPRLVNSDESLSPEPFSGGNSDEYSDESQRFHLNGVGSTIHLVNNSSESRNTLRLPKDRPTKQLLGPGATSPRRKRGNAGSGMRGPFPKCPDPPPPLPRTHSGTGSQRRASRAATAVAACSRRQRT